MKVTFLVTSSGGSFYCSNCYRDMLYFRAVKLESNITATAVPLYLPPEKMYTDAGFDSNVFFGAISLYLREKVHFLSQMPSFVDKVLDAPPLLRLASKRAGTTRSEGMEDMTLGMIDSNHKTREKEVERLVRYIMQGGKPDIIHLSNALIIGLANQIKKLIDVKLVCSLQNEDDWINDMAEPFRTQAWKMIGKESENIDAFVVPSGYYKDYFSEVTGVPREKIFLIPSGIDVHDEMPLPGKTEKPSIGFFSRANYHNGFDKITDAYISLKKEAGFNDLMLHVCGGYTADDKPFIAEQIRKIKESGFKSDVKVYPEFVGDYKSQFLSSIDVLSVPVRKYDAYGLYILEANAAGIPAVQPATGAFPEILETTGGGILYTPDTVEALVENIRRLLTDQPLARMLGESGRRVVRDSLTLRHMSEGLSSLYKTLA